MDEELRKKIEAKKKTHIFYDDWCEWFIGLNPEDVVELARGIAFAYRGQRYDAKTITAKTLLKTASTLIESDREAYIEKVAKQTEGAIKQWERIRSTNGQPMVNHKSTNGNHMVTNTDIDIENDIENDIDLDNKKDLKKEKDKKEKSFCADAELNTAIIDFIKYRKAIKAPMTDKAIKLMITKLGKFSDSIPEQIAIINQSILNGWKGIFPLKQEDSIILHGGDPKLPKHIAIVDTFV